MKNIDVHAISCWLYKIIFSSILGYKYLIIKNKRLLRWLSFKFFFYQMVDFDSKFFTN